MKTTKLTRHHFYKLPRNLLATKYFFLENSKPKNGIFKKEDYVGASRSNFLTGVDDFH